MGKCRREVCARNSDRRQSDKNDRFWRFCRAGAGVDALLHVSQISKAHVDKPSDVLNVGQEITAKIVDLNVDEKKISLSMKALEKNTEEAAEQHEAEEEE